MVHSTFSRSGQSVVRSAVLAKGGTLKKRPSLHLHKVPTQSNKSPRTFQMALVGRQTDRQTDRQVGRCIIKQGGCGTTQKHIT